MSLAVNRGGGGDKTRFYCITIIFLMVSLFNSIASLYNWRYKKLGSLPHVLSFPEYQLSNAGFQFDYQLINVENFNGVGESEPNPYFYQVGMIRLNKNMYV